MQPEAVTAFIGKENDNICYGSETIVEQLDGGYCSVISNEFIPFLPLFAELDKRLAEGQVKVAIEGGSGSGKTTLGRMLSDIYDCTVFHMDDFFLRPEQRTPERFAEPGGNVDRERFLSEVLQPLSIGEPFSYRKFDCSSMSLGESVTVMPKKLIVTEGAYSMHPELASYYDFSVFLDISPELQKKRITQRNTPSLAERFFNEWIPLEREYFSAMNIKEQCDMVISVR
ncbi:MAG: hypothetical protein IKM66_09505 [Clostridia bacterium]|nr:hypothetical protein [Clostridia bacterium]